LKEWTEKFQWLILNNIKEQMTLSCNIYMPGVERQTKVLTMCPNV